MSDHKNLLSFVELGGYPNFRSFYESLGYNVTEVTQARKAISMLKKQPPQVVVAEFNFQSDFRDRTSSLESILATLERFGDTQAIIFYDKEFEAPLQRLLARFPVEHLLAHPITEEKIGAALDALAADVIDSH